MAGRDATQVREQRTRQEESTPPSPRQAHPPSTGGCSGLNDEPWASVEPLRARAQEPALSRRRAVQRAGPEGGAEAIFFVLRTGCQWNARDASSLCASSTAHDRFQAWVADGFFLRFWQAGRAEYDAFNGLDRAWMSTAGAITQAPLSGEGAGALPGGSRQGGRQTLVVRGGRRRTRRPLGGWANRNDFKRLEETLHAFARPKPEPTRAKPQHMLLGKGGDEAEARAILPAHGLIAHIRSCGEEAAAKKKQPDAGWPSAPTCWFTRAQSRANEANLRKRSHRARQTDKRGMR